MFSNKKKRFCYAYRKTSSLEFSLQIVTNSIKLQPIIKNNNKKALLHCLIIFLKGILNCHQFFILSQNKKLCIFKVS